MITSTPAGLYCEDGAFHIDPWQPVERAVITHAHGDHARAGSRAYLCSPECAPLLRHRVPEGVIETSAWREPITMGRVRVSFHPAGHILGSAQIRLEHGGEVWVVSGDYKRMPDPTCAAFEPVPCHTFITEATFGLPIYTLGFDDERHRRNSCTGGKPIVRRDVRRCSSATRSARRSACSPSCGMLSAIRSIFTARCWRFTDIYRAVGVATGRNRTRQRRRPRTRRWPVLSSWRRSRRAGRRGCGAFRNPSTAFASGLMRVRGVRRQRGFDRGFVLSDHADWRALLDTIAETGASACARHARLVRRAGALSRRARPGDRHTRDQVRGRDGRARDRAEPANMKRFAALYDAIDRTTSTNAKVAALAAYFRDAPPADAAWAVFFLTGRRLKRLVPSAAAPQWSRGAHRHPGLAARRVLRSGRRLRRADRPAARSGRQRGARTGPAAGPWVEDRLLPLAKMDPAASA